MQPTKSLRKRAGIFLKKELGDLTLAIATINAWNRLLISARTVPGKYEPGGAHFDKAAA